jgi:outer membrane protein
MPISMLRRAAFAGTGLALVLAAVPAQADTLKDALASAYETNPTLLGARATQRATDENVPISRASGLPSLSGTATFSEQLKDAANDPLGFVPDRTLNGTLNLTIPVYSGGGTRNSILAAKTRVEAGQADLRGTESFVFAQVVAAYMDVILQEAIVGLSKSNVEVLEVNLEATSDRFEIGNLTRTDVAQSQSRLALAQGDLRSSRANLVSARERYIQLVGNAPGDLAAPPPLPGLPDTVDEAVEIALENNPDLIGARERSKASGYDIDVAGAGRLPRVEVFTRGNYNDTLSSDPGNGPPYSSTSASAGVSLTIPIMQGGRVAAQERQAQARASAAFEQEIAAERDVIATVRAAFSSWRAANSIIDSTQAAVDAAELSLEGVRAENTVGNRTILNVLDAQQELLRAQVQHVTARRNAYVAGFNLLAAMGKAEARDLGLGDEGLLYDPEVNYERVRGKFFDWEFDEDPTAEASRTVDTPAQDGNIPEDN